MLKRIFDFICAFIGLSILSPIILLFSVLIWLQDFKSPLYRAPRIKRDGQTFRMLKLRSMVSNADQLGGVSTTTFDKRITPLGKIIRRFKIDELTQLWNVFIGDMSLVGPRPQSYEGGTALYTEEERRLLKVRPGITDLASLVFADEGDVLSASSDPDLAYNQLIRPWKSRFGLFYVKHHSLMVDIQLISLTIFGIFSREYALHGLQKILKDLGAEETLVRIAGRKEELKPYPPPGSNEIVESLVVDDHESSA